MTAAGSENSVDDKGFDLLEEFRAVLRMSLQTNRLGKIQAENAHDGFGVDGIPSRNQIHVKVVLRNSVHKGLDVVDGVQHDVAGSHGIDLHSVDFWQLRRGRTGSIHNYHIYNISALSF